MQTASIRASLGYCGSNSGMVAMTMPTVEMTTKMMEMLEITWAAFEVSGFSMRSHKQIWYLTNLPDPKSSGASVLKMLALRENILFLDEAKVFCPPPSSFPLLQTLF